jgi:hypothetical protein
MVIELLGGVMSSMMVSENGVVFWFPAASLYHAYTVFVPSPVVNVHAFDVAYVSHVVHELVLLTHIWETPLASDADNVKVTDVVFVYAAPLLIVIEPVGGVTSAPSSLVIVTVALLGVPIVYAAFEMKVTITVSSLSTAVSLIGVTVMDADADPAGICTYVPMLV